VVVHHEGVSHGTDVASGVKAFQSINQKKFLDRWRTILEREHFERGQHRFVARDRTASKPCLVVVSQQVPAIGKGVGTSSVVRLLRRCFDLGANVKLWADEASGDAIGVPELQQVGIEVLHPTDMLEQFEGWLRENGHYVDFFLLVGGCDQTIDLIKPIRRYTNAKIVHCGIDDRAESETVESLCALLQAGPAIHAQGNPSGGRAL
jgi:hypothetical protein